MRGWLLRACVGETPEQSGVVRMLKSGRWGPLVKEGKKSMWALCGWSWSSLLLRVFLGKAASVIKSLISSSSFVRGLLYPYNPITGSW